MSSNISTTNDGSNHDTTWAFLRPDHFTHNNISRNSAQSSRLTSQIHTPYETSACSSARSSCTNLSILDEGYEQYGNILQEQMLLNAVTSLLVNNNQHQAIQANQDQNASQHNESLFGSMIGDAQDDEAQVDNENQIEFFISIRAPANSRDERN
ncbi:uncharacterized protein L201_006026 [Kwoniella dendrophila CBS 6074]|uniref:Uncharacterized protein n=1 Tax=Kwoniella dendrophila CBS 6074 TaxID=1295534 RepID=A0AAX4K2U7_9TREE